MSEVDAIYRQALKDAETELAQLREQHAVRLTRMRKLGAVIRTMRANLELPEMDLDWLMELLHPRSRRTPYRRRQK